MMIDVAGVLPRTVVDVISERVAACPEAPAVSAADQTLSYGELWSRSGAIAGALHRCGVDGISPIGLLCDRSTELVTGLLGIMRAGAAYVPLEPTYPAQRLQAMVEDCAATTIVTQRRLISQARQLGAPIVLAADDVPAEGARGTAPVERDLAYVMYTSGSTGEPKGVAIEHGALLNRLAWMQSAFSLDARDAVVQKTPFSFDVSVWELLWPLMFGGRLVMAAPGRHVDAAYLRELIGRERITIAHFVPSMLRAFLVQPDIGGCESLRLLIASGEVLSPALAQAALDATRAEVCNLYGPTEATIDASWWRCRGDEQRTVPIGHAIDGVALHVLDGDRRPCPAGVEGEIAISGVGLARGYVGRPQLTQERFPAIELEHVPTRVYLTGDRGVLRPDGALEFRGRADAQVKLRGYRIELGEVEAALLAQPGVVQALAGVEQDGERERLISHVVMDTSPQAPAENAARLRAALREQLPDFMVPSAIRVHDVLPATANGKAALPASPARPATHPVATSPTERALIGIWEQVLQVRCVTATSDFFELGGSSIEAARVAVELASRVADLAGEDFDPLVALFEWPTVRELAAAIDEHTER